MDALKRKQAEGWIEGAGNSLAICREQFKALHWAESIRASQECVELSVKGALLLLNIDFDRSHNWKGDEIQQIAKQLRESGVMERLAANPNLYRAARLPRLLLLFRFWGEFYSTAKYGLAGELRTPASDLFERKEAELAQAHAEECHYAASDLRYLPEGELAALRRES